MFGLEVSSVEDIIVLSLIFVLGACLIAGFAGLFLAAIGVL